MTVFSTKNWEIFTGNGNSIRGSVKSDGSVYISLGQVTQRLERHAIMLLVAELEASGRTVIVGKSATGKTWTSIPRAPE